MATPVPYTGTFAQARENEDLLFKEGLTNSARAILEIPEDEDFTFENAEQAVQEGRIDASILEETRKEARKFIADTYEFPLDKYKEAIDEVEKDRQVVLPDGKTLAEFNEERAGVGAGIAARGIEIIKNIPTDIAEISGDVVDDAINAAKLVYNLPFALGGNEESKRVVGEYFIRNFAEMNAKSPEGLNKVLKKAGASEKDVDAIQESLVKYRKENPTLGKQITDPVKETVGKAVEVLEENARSSELGNKIVDSIYRTADPQLTITEDILADIFMIGANVKALRSWTTGNKKYDSVALRMAAASATGQKKRKIQQEIDRRTKLKPDDPQYIDKKELPARVGKEPILKPDALKIKSVPRTYAETTAAYMAIDSGEESLMPMLLLDDEEIRIRESDTPVFREILAGINALDNHTNGAVSETLNKLTVNPDDSAATRRLKQLVDIGLADGILVGTLGLAGRGAKATISAPKNALRIAADMKDAGTRTLNLSKKVKEGIRKPPETSEGSIVSGRTEVIEDAPGEFKQQGVIRRYVGKWNTKAGRLFRSDAGLPEEMHGEFLKSKRWLAATEKRTKRLGNEVESVIRDFNLDRTVVNEALHGNQKAIRTLAPKAAERLAKVAREFSKNESLIKKALRIPQNQKLSAAVGPDGVYMTRSFRFTQDPQWSKRIRNYVETGNVQNPLGRTWSRLSTDLGTANKAYNDKIIEVVENGKEYLRKTMGITDEAELNAIIKSIVDGDNGKVYTGFLDLLEGKVPQGVAKGLRKRKELDKPILELLGEIKDPVLNTLQTLRTQNNIIARVRYMDKLAKYASENVGKEIKVSGLLPIGRQTTTFTKTASKKGKISKDVGDLTGTFDDYIDEQLGSLGANTTLRKLTPQDAQRLAEINNKRKQNPASLTPDEKKFLNEVSGERKLELGRYATSPLFQDILTRGIDAFNADRFYKALPFGSFVRNAVGYGQNVQTILDHTAYMLQVSGAAFMLAANGHLFNPARTAKNLMVTVKKYSDRLVGDPTKEDLELFEFLIGEGGVLDTNLVTGTLQDNVKTLDDVLAEMSADQFDKGFYNRLIKTPFRKLGDVYGATDNAAKLTAFFGEFDDLAKIYPDADQKQLWRLAADRVKNTAPNYGTAAPIARFIGRTPVVGTYVLFPAEVLRTSYNIIKYGIHDFSKGVYTGNKALAMHGMKRLAGLAAVTAGMNELIKDNNIKNGWTENNTRLIKSIDPDYAYSSRKLAITPLYYDDEGNIVTRYGEYSMIDAYSYLFDPVNEMVARAMSTSPVDPETGEYREPFTETEQNEFFNKVARNVLSPYYSGKSMATAGLSLLANVDERGNPIIQPLTQEAFRENPFATDTLRRIGEDVFPVLERTLKPGGLTNYNKEVDAVLSETFRNDENLTDNPDSVFSKRPPEGYKIGLTRAGYPNRAVDAKVFNRTGFKIVTNNVSRGVGRELYDGMRLISSNRKAPVNAIREIENKDIAKFKESYNQYISDGLDSKQAVAFAAQDAFSGFYSAVDRKAKDNLEGYVKVRDRAARFFGASVLNKDGDFVQPTPEDLYRAMSSFNEVLGPKYRVNENALTTIISGEVLPFYGTQDIEDVVKATREKLYNSGFDMGGSVAANLIENFTKYIAARQTPSKDLINKLVEDRVTYLQFRGETPEDALKIATEEIQHLDLPELQGLTDVIIGTEDDPLLGLKEPIEVPLSDLRNIQ
jgi:hypothetical protein